MSHWRIGAAALLWLLADCPMAFAQTEIEITEARLKGIDYIKSKQDIDGSWPYEGHNTGITALCTLSLLENGVAIYDPAVDKGYRFVRKQAATNKDTYDLALGILLLSRVGDRQDRALIRGMGARLLAGQLLSGGWSYSCPSADLSVLADVRKIEKKEGYGDNSCTQFAVLGLWVASRYGVPIEDAMVAVAKRFVEDQNKDGGWGYVNQGEGAPSRESMSCAGLFCLSVARATRIRQLQREERSSSGKRTDKDSLQNDPVFSKGYELVGTYAKGIHPGWPRYSLWSVERLGVLFGVDKIGDAEWFSLGAGALLKAQQADGSWPDGKNGLSDTSFALLFLRKANLGSDITRLLAGQPEFSFQIANRDPVPRFETLQDALQSSQPGDVIRVDGNGPYKMMHDEIAHDLTLQAGFGYDPVFEFQIGISPKGLRYKPEQDVAAQHMLKISGGNVLLEGLRLQMDPPVTSAPLPWKTVYVTGGHLRMLNCSISEGNRRGSKGVVIAAPEDHTIRNSSLVGGAAAIEVVAAGEQSITLDNSILYSNLGINVVNDSSTKAPADLTLYLTQSTINSTEAFSAPDLKGKVHIDSALCVYKCEALGLKYLAVANQNTDRSWKGLHNAYNVVNWVGSQGKKAAITDPKTWSKFWGGADQDHTKLTISFVVPHGKGAFTHGLLAQDWDLSEKSELAFSTIRYGVHAANIGAGEGFSRYREDFQYGEWKKGNYAPLITTETGLE